MTDDELTEIIIGCAYQVHNSLGAGFLEKVYENALCIELTKRGLVVRQQVPIQGQLIVSLERRQPACQTSTRGFIPQAMQAGCLRSSETIN